MVPRPFFPRFSLSKLDYRLVDRSHYHDDDWSETDCHDHHDGSKLAGPGASTLGLALVREECWWDFKYMLDCRSKTRSDN